ncbi:MULTISPECIES: exopolysaccharide biosynthesis polyprenyl glycosylphosphotransferase [Flavobacterium]|uniref:Exopolysaccharide biosynthesis polyprenyl glycosylphosphotransferase n=2 Tax=Flavobacterium TaxID=237 RepID=A0A2N9PB96_9FLAO|nr:MULTISPECIES: exopolysaccharide biosynthesis polyprenyl glycosylphosphotransferase [Flavobacterium]QYS88047.1 exopolysaccharide biosynthesis polyprenyl glycosylphosphotransferase [Flavobacterium davisii]RVU90890.1 exopolysaccharide biosynthesis polyprenyl glycosylphosphotransferase [Flavobacterium columnare]SPE77601.1 UDP-glucose:undecaprenyl-phosphate glucose-1-phosphate transferase [Flavobacterium columnare]
MAVGRYSKYIRPISYLVDFLLIVWLLLLLFPVLTFNLKEIISLLIVWTITSNFTEFYEIYRFTAPVKIFFKTLKQLSIFSSIFITLIFILEKGVTHQLVFKYLFCLTLFVTFFKFGIYYSLRKYRQLLGGNYRRVIIIGQKEKAIELADFFKQNKDLGYRLYSMISENISFIELKKIIKEQSIDEIYCDLNSISKEYSDDVIAYAHNHFKTIKLIPDNSALSHNMSLDYYGYIPLISIRKTPLELWFNHWIKRLFDILFSFLVILFVLSWLIPLIALLIKIDSKGPIFFKQQRHGINNQSFDCFKFRSMKINDLADRQLASKDDERVTALGKFLRKSSIDEMPQFINVLLGDMSVVGPRPQMLSVNEDYAQRFDKFMERHYIKPGVTGLAQIKGCRGEILTDQDIEDRLKFDLFYIENWTLLLDIKIILVTLKKFILGDEKAY